MSVQEQLAIAKAKKQQTALIYGEDLCFDHPIRLMGIGMSGTVEWINDERGYSAASSYYEAWVDTVNVDYSLCDGYVRIPFAAVPFYQYDWPPPLVTEGEFQLYQKGPLKKAWELFMNLYSHGSPFPICGSFVRKRYTSASTGPPWTLDSTETLDVRAGFNAVVSGGGKAYMHGNDGTTPARINVGIWTEGGYLESAAYPDMDDYADAIERMPWGFPWASETDAFLNKFNDRLAYCNGFRGGGFSGSCSLSLDFT